MESADFWTKPIPERGLLFSPGFKIPLPGLELGGVPPPPGEFAPDVVILAVGRCATRGPRMILGPFLVPPLGAPPVIEDVEESPVAVDASDVVEAFGPNDSRRRDDDREGVVLPADAWRTGEAERGAPVPPVGVVLPLLEDGGFAGERDGVGGLDGTLGEYVEGEGADA